MVHSLPKVFNPQPGWYCSDFHAHTTFSDGFYSPPDLRLTAVNEKLDFLTVTDHNNLRAMDFLDAGLPSMVLPGVEVTLTEGHFNVFGMEGNTAGMRDLFLPWLDIMSFPRRETSLKHLDLENLIQRLIQADLVLSINHPLLAPWEWRDALTDVNCFHCIELINDPNFFDNYKSNPLTRRMWSAWLNAGLRVTGIGGSDFHTPEPSNDRSRAARLGQPSTYVYARELSGQAILEGLRAGRAYTTMGPSIEFWAECDGAKFQIGDEIPSPSDRVRCYARASGATAPGRAYIVANGNLVQEIPLEAGRAEIEFVLNPEKYQSGWIRFDVIGDDDQSLALSNPIYFGARQLQNEHNFGKFLDIAVYPKY